MGSQGATASVCQIIEKKFVLLTPKVGILEKCCEIPRTKPAELQKLM